jgi:cardiolipin synthase
MDNHNQNKNALKLLVTSWPNLISLGRLLSAPLFIWLILSDRMFVAFIGCLLAALSDAADGFVARILKSQSTIGAYLDPLADKILLASLYFTLGYKGFIMPWLVILIVFRDFLIIGGTFLLMSFKKTFKVQPLMISKINTLLQISAVAWILCNLGLTLKAPQIITQLLLNSVAITTFLSGGAYIVLWLRYLAQQEVQS